MSETEDLKEQVNIHLAALETKKISNLYQEPHPIQQPGDISDRWCRMW